MSVSDSSKHLIQICELLEERRMSFSFCLNKADLLVLCGMALLYQSLELKQESKLLKDNEKVVNTVIKTVGRMKASVAFDFRRVADLLIKVDEPPQSLPTPPGHSPDSTARRSSQKGSSPVASKPKKKLSSQLVTHQPQPYSIGRHSSVSEMDLLVQQEKLKKITMPSLPQLSGARGADTHRPSSRSSLDSGRPNAASLAQRRDQRLSMSQAAMVARVSPPLPQKANLDFLALGNAVPQHHPSPPSSLHINPVISPDVSAPSYYPSVQQQPIQPKSTSTTGILATEWEVLLGPLEGGAGQPSNSLYDNMYCGTAQLPLENDPVTSSSIVDGSWSPESIDLSTFNLGDFGGNPHGSSLSEESLSSVSGGDDFSSLDFGEFSVSGQGGMMSGTEGFALDGVRSGSHFL